MMKIAPIAAEVARVAELDQVLVHTGQHYDRELSEIFIEQLKMDPPAHTLDAGSGSHAQQTARVMERLEPLLTRIKPSVVLVPGDVNSTLGRLWPQRSWAFLSATSKRGCGASTARCPRSSTGS